MMKPIKSSVRKLLYTMINKFTEVKTKMKEELDVNHQNLDAIITLTEFLCKYIMGFSFRLSSAYHVILGMVKRLSQNQVLFNILLSKGPSKRLCLSESPIYHSTLAKPQHHADAIRLKSEKTSSSEETKANIKEIVVNLKTLAEKEMLSSETQYLEKISSMTEISIQTLRRIKKEGSINQGKWNTPGKKRPHPKKICVDSFDISAIRNKINEYYCSKKQVPTLRSLHVELREAIGFEGGRETLRKILHDSGFEFKNNQNERTLLIERYEIAAWRHRYLRQINQKRQEGKPIIYLDETYVHQNYKVKKSWQGPSTSGVTTKISSGKRHIVVHAGSKDGFVPGALLVFSTKSKSADYHDDMNSANFMKWLDKKLIPNLNCPSVVVMDNASYHVVQLNKPPTMSSNKSVIRKWLQENNINFEEYHSRQELMCIVQDNKPAPTQAAELLKSHGHEVIMLPPYHCDLNPIELVWSQAKRKIASKNIGIPATEMENLIKECFDSVTPNDWKKYTDHIINIENKYKEKDYTLANELEPFIINVGQESSTTSEESHDSDSISGVEYLESDFDYDS